MNAHAKVCPLPSAADLLADDIAQIVSRVPYIEVAPSRMFDASLASELAEAVDRLACKVARLSESHVA